MLPFQDEPLHRPNTYELIADSVIQMIRAGRLSPGDLLPPEKTLMDKYGTGRSSVREALRVLESKGAITGSRGTFVVANVFETLSSSFGLLMSLTGARMRDLIELRRIIEVETAGLAAVNRTDDQVALLWAANDRWEAALVEMDDEESTKAAGKADLDVHVLIAKAAGNVTVVAVIEALRDVAARNYRQSIETPQIRDAVSEQHRAIIAAIAQGDRLAAELAARAHISHVERGLGSLLDEPLRS